MVLFDDVRQAIRGLVQARRFAVWIVGSLAVGIAVTTAAFALLNALLVRPFPAVVDQDRLVRIAMSRPCGAPDCWAPVAHPDIAAALDEGLPGLASVASYTVADVAVGLPAARTMRTAFVSARYFEVLGTGTAVGRATALNAPGAPGAIISDRVWREAFGADPAVIGRPLRVGDQFATIVGVAPPMFAGIDLRPARGDRGPDLWLPLALADRLVAPADDGSGPRDLRIVGRLRAGVDRAAVQAQAHLLAMRLAAAAGGAAVPARANVTPVTLGNPRHRNLTIAIVLPIPVLVLLIACLNAAHLMLARAAERRRDIAIRLAIGAGRGRIIRQLFIESLVLALLAAAAALPLAWWGLRLADSPIGLPLPLDWAVLAATAATAVATTVGFGLVPALRVSGQSPVSTLGVMGTHDQATPGRSRARRALLAAQVALSIGLLATAWQLVATVRLSALAGGVPADRLLIARFDLETLPAGAVQRDAFYRDLLARASRLPGVAGAGLAQPNSVWTFGQGGASSLDVWLPTDDGAIGRPAIGGYVSDGLFAAVGLRVLAGRGFTAADRQGAPAVAVINDAAARRIPGSAVGAILRVAPRGSGAAAAMMVRIVGVVESVAEPRMDRAEAPSPRIYLPAPLGPQPALALFLRSHGDAAALAQPLRELVGALAPRVPVVDAGTLDEHNLRAFGPQLWLARAAAALGLIALVLAAAGLYGIASQGVAARSREIGVRMALGAAPRTIVAMIFAQSMRIAVIGLGLGGVTAIGLSRIIQAGYHGIERLDAMALGGAAATFAAAMLVASLVPALRAARLDPVETLKDA